MGAILLMQLSAFGNKRIIPSENTITAMMPKLRELSGVELLPSIMNAQKLNIMMGAIETVPNLAFTSVGNDIQIICTENRVDCTFSFEMDRQDTVEECFGIAASAIEYIMQYGDIFANRLALNINYVSDVCVENSRFERQIMCVVPYYQNKPIKEWSTRTNAVEQIQLYEEKEDLNVIAEYTRGMDATSGEIRVLCHADINTLAENKDFRFRHDVINTFLEQAHNIFKDIQSDLEGLVKDEE